METMISTLRKPRIDALPENLDYRDSGCDLYPSCLACPLPRCRYDDPGGAAQMLRTGRDATIYTLSERDGLSIDRLAAMFGLSRRTISACYGADANRTKARLPEPLSCCALTIASMQAWTFVDGKWVEGDQQGGAFTWFCLESPDAAALESLRVRFGLHPLAVEDCLSLNLHAPKIDEFADHIFLVCLAPRPGSAGATEEFDAFLGEDFIITYTDHPLPAVAAVRDTVAGGVRLRPGPDGIVYEIVDRMVDAFVPATSAMADALDELEHAVLDDPSQLHSRAIIELRATAGQLRRLLTPQHTVFQRLSRGEIRYVQEPNRIYFRDIYDHLVRVDLGLESVREDAEMAMSTYMSNLNNRMNEVMKVLSIVAALALPATVIAGIFGTNFDNVPGLHSNWGFAFMIVAMAVLAVSMAWYFKSRHWW